MHAHDTHPIWSPDSKKIAFASNRQGSMDIYIIDKEGGTPQRLTTHSANEFPVTFKDAEHILYLSSLMPDAADMTFPSGQFPQVYEISTEGAADIIRFPANGRHQLQQRRKILIVPRPERIRRCLEKASYFIHHTGHLDVSAKRKRKDLPETDFIQRRRPYSDLECRRPVVLLPERIQRFLQCFQKKP